MKLDKVIKKAIIVFTNTGENLLSLLYPNICPFCGRVLVTENKGRICERCQFRLPYIYEPRCKKCGQPLEKETQEYCWDCEHHKHYYEKGVAVWGHHPDVSHAIYQFKYHNRRIYSRFFAKEMVKSYEFYFYQWNIDVIVPIPISRKRRRERGYNQTELLAKEIGKLTRIPVETKGLIRIKETRAQKVLNVRERRKNLKDAFRWTGDGNMLDERNILLVDDIYTTGSTIDEAARILKKSGAKNVYFMTISIGQGY